MTKKELARLRRKDLLELLLIQRKENEQLRAQVYRLQAQLEDKNLAIENAGSIAEASLRLNAVFEAAQAASDQFLQNTLTRCDQMEQETKKRCQAMLAANGITDYEETDK